MRLMQAEKAKANELDQTDAPTRAVEQNGPDERRAPPAAPEMAAHIVGLSKSFKGTQVLDDVTFDVAEGESLVLLGASGSGKT
ncbi:MAG TPA: hypothetical protein VE821_02725, partial [Pyrinomonadaceae bacterium]|nr:hypothetical protein [Pyrinomonadaceae bacterium]